MGAPALAQSPLPAPKLPEAAPAATPADLEELIRTLEDPARRDALLGRLKALTAAAAPAEPEAGAVAGAIDSLEGALRARLDTAGDTVLHVAGSLGQVPILLAWTGNQLADPATRALWTSVALQAGAAVIAGILASLVVRLPLRGWRDRISDLPPGARRRPRVRAFVAHLAVDLAALVTFLIVTFAVLVLTAATPLAAGVAGEVLLAIGCVRGLTAFSRALLAPENAHRRLAAVGDETARSTQRWLGTVLGLAFYGHFGLEAAERLGLPWSLEAFLRHLLFFGVTVLLVIQIYRLRGGVAALIRRWGESPTSLVSRYLPWQALAATGHHLFAAWVVLVFLVWALGVRDGAVLLTRGLLVTVLALLAVRVLHVWLERMLLARAAATDSEDGAEAEREPPPTGRVVLVTAIRGAALLVALGFVMEAWGLNVTAWLRTATGLGLLASIGRIAAVIIVIGVLAKIVQALSAGYIAAVDEDGRPTYSNRTRTLVSMARNLVLTLLGAIAIVEVLSELGVNANALLAGAGVVGLAVGFGSQKLVQDLINGLFVLLGDTVRVGDVVDLTGKAGVVEAISMRTITLRDYNGNVHTIPYSSIDVVTNMTKEFSFAVFDLNIAHREDVDRVMDILSELDAQLRREWPYRRLILEPLEIAGVDQFRESSILIKARSKVRAGEQWKVGREFNRRLKRRFDELGIELPLPQRAIHLIGGRSGEEPPAVIDELRRRLVAADGAGMKKLQAAGDR